MIDWKPSANLSALQNRAALLADLRRFFSGRGVMEIDVPVMARDTVTDPNIESFVVVSPDENTSQYYLMTSPEFYMKRLLAAGAGSIYYLGKSFRADEKGSCHLPEFTMLEWYRPRWDLQQLMEEVIALVSQYVAGDIHKITYKQAFLDQLGIDPHAIGLVELKLLAHEKLSPAFDSEERGVWLDLLFSHLVEPNLRGIVFVEQFPAAQAALSQTMVDECGNPVAARFELYIDGMEIANAYQEELDASVLSKRFDSNLGLRKQRGQSLPSIDEKFLAAMTAGMPVCAGVALGVDRLLMAMYAEKDIAAVVPFVE